MHPNRAIFLDRDGVINRATVLQGKPFPPKNLSYLEILPGVAEGLQALSDAGFLLIVITNQPDVARGLTTKECVDEINLYLQTHLPLKDIRTCYHQDQDGCLCRKPAPGALIATAKEYQLSLEHCYMIGDRLKDIEAGIRAGCKTIFIDHNYDEPKPMNMNHTTANLKDAANLILGEST